MEEMKDGQEIMMVNEMLKNCIEMGFAKSFILCVNRPCEESAAGASLLSVQGKRGDIVQSLYTSLSADQRLLSMVVEAIARVIGDEE